MTVNLGTLMIGGVCLFIAWAFWVLASGLLGVTLGQVLVSAVIFAAGYTVGRGA